MYRTTGSASAATGSMFRDAQNTLIAGGSFSINTCTTNFNQVNAAISEPLAKLHKRAAPNAILNAGGRADDVRCHPGTRKEVLDRIERWRDAQDILTPPIFWLSGPAGAGKTAIVQTVAERCNAQGIPQANFFFFRTDPSRNKVFPLVATLVHQIILLYPSLRGTVATALSTNPLILDSVLENQLEQLIIAPLQAIRDSDSFYIPPLLLLDGLDECDSEKKHSQQQILGAFDRVLKKHSWGPFRLLVASRDESQIRAAFNNVASKLRPLYLDSQYSPESDIRIFVNDEFKRIRMMHPLAHTLTANWPTVKDVNNIVRKSSGHFIYAATVMRYVMDSSASPMLSLARVQGAAQVSTKSPFSYLDAVYEYILSQVNDQQALKDIFHAHFLLQHLFRDALSAPVHPADVLVKVLEVYSPRYNRTVVESCLADLTPIVARSSVIGNSGLDPDNNGSLLFHHASFPDYLLDKSRSREYFVDFLDFNNKIQPAVWEASANWWRRTHPGAGLRDVAYNGLTILDRLPPGLLDTLMELGPSEFNTKFDMPRKTVTIFKHLSSLCTHDHDVTKYKQILRRWIYTQPLEYGLMHGQQPSLLKWPPHSHKYLAMGCIEHDIMTEPHGWVDTALHPETDSEAHETALWLNSLLHRIYREIYLTDVREYNHLVRRWVSWATCHNIPLIRVDDIPRAWWYCAMAQVEHNIITEPDAWLCIALRQATDIDICEAESWLNELLCRIHREKYQKSAQEYNELLRKWLSWATWNGIPLNGVDSLPNAWWYLQRSRIEKWASNYLGALGSHW